MNHFFEIESTTSPFALMFPDPARDAVARSSRGGNNRVFIAKIAEQERAKSEEVRKKARERLPLPRPETMALAATARLAQRNK
jgi:hypothetical protein